MDRPPGSLSSKWYAVRQDGLAPLAIAAGLFIVFLGIIPFAHTRSLYPASLEFSQTLMLSAALLVAAMSFADFRVTGRKSPAIMGAAYLFYVVDAVASLGVLPQFLPPDQQLRYASASPWLYTVRHFTFALFVIWYAIEARGRDGKAFPRYERLRPLTLILATLSAALAVSILTVIATPSLPALVGEQALRDFVAGPFVVSGIALLTALFMILRIRRPARLDQWLALAIWAFFLDLTGHTLDVERFTVVFYFYRLAELVGIFAVLGFLVYYGFESYRSASVEVDAIGERRREQQSRFAATVNSAAIGIAHVGEDGRLLFVNEQFARITGRNPLELVNQMTIWDIFGAKAVPLRDSPAPSFEASLSRADASTALVTVVISPSRSYDRSADYWIAVVNDVTARKQAEQISLQMNDIKSQFIATVTHEIRTPLSGIVGVSELLKRTTLTEKQLRFAETMDSSAHTLLRLVNDVLDFSKIEGAGVELDSTLFDVIHLVESVAEGFGADASRRGLHIGVHVSPAVAGGFYGDPVRLRQILDNLVNNALKFTERGEVTLSVEESSSEGDRTALTFRVTDTGIGIPVADQERIFEVFTQAESSSTRRYGGSGLGLAIVRKLVNLMGGEIVVYSEEGCGSTFSCTIPLEREAEGRRLDPAATSLRGLRCLVVSAEPSVRKDVLSHMISWGMLVGAFGSMREALEGLRHPTDPGAVANCAVIDGDLVDAAQLAAALSDDHRFEDLQFVFLGSVPETAATSISTWRRRLIPKPVRTSSLYDAISQLCVQRNGRSRGEMHLDLPPLRSERILVAEDNETNRMLAMAQLEHLGFGADFVEDGAGALAAAKTGLYALVLMDGQMPRTDGFEATRSIRDFERGGRPHIPIVAMTASTSAEYRERCLAAGMDDYLAKPVLLSSLQAVLDRWLPRDILTRETAPVPVRNRSLSAVDFTRLRTIFRGDENAIQKVLDSALRTFDDGLEEIGEAIFASDHVRIAKSAHRMAGVALDVDLVPIASLCRLIESDATAESNGPQLEATVEEIEAAVEDFRLAVATIKASESSVSSDV